ncbi:MAG: methionyl aminopeptidase [Solirubrobacteraceae bacterium]|jgi:methionyl aminopeptidase|nr:methionyl aminopeptidase [Solirubrobacteraceae bacterium]
MSVNSPDELAALQAAGRVVAVTIRAMRRAVRPGVTTAELDAIAAREFARAGARSGPQLDYGFPGVTCISVNDEAVHGIPGRRRLRRGDLVKLDVTAELDGYYADACRTVVVGEGRPQAIRLIRTAEHALSLALKVASAGRPLNAIGATVQQAVEQRGFSVCEGLAGHGIGRRIHEPPDVPNSYEAARAEPLGDGLVITIEPLIAAGGAQMRMGRDGWTVRTADASWSAHAEHTIVVRDGAPLVLTA